MLFCGFLFGLAGCERGKDPAIAVIPRTSGTMLWEPEDVGAQTEAKMLRERIYWNASTREDDIDGQIALVERVSTGGYKGLILSPDHSLALITPVRRALAKGLPIVILGSPLPIPASDDLGYILNDEKRGGKLAAERVAVLTHGRGVVALVGIDPDIAGIMSRAASFQQWMSQICPQVHVVLRKMGTFNAAHEQEVVQELLRERPDVNVIVALTSTSTHGAVSTVQAERINHPVAVIGFDPDSFPFENESLDSVIIQDTRAMGERAVRLIHARAAGMPLPAEVDFEPVLVTRENLSSPKVQQMIFMDWRPGAAHLRWSSPR